MDTTYWDNLGKPTVHIDEFYENEACDDGIARLLEGRERQEEFTFQDILEGHNIQDDIAWFIIAMIADEFKVDYRRVVELVLEFAANDPHSLPTMERLSKSCIESGKIGSREIDTAGRIASWVSYGNCDGYASGAHKLLNYINNNWKTHR